MALGTATKQGAGGGGGGGSSTITSFLGSTTNAPMNITQVGGSPFALGQQLAAASLPVVLTASQLTTLTPPSNTGYALDSSLSTIDTDLKSNITLHAGSNTIGSVKVTDGTNTQTFMSTTTTSKFGADINILSILGTAPTTAGKLDVKGADGDVFVRQTTGTNLHMVVDSGTVTTVTTVSTVTNVSQINGISPTFNSSTFSAKQALDVNPLGTLGTAFTDAGKMNVQGGVATNTAVADKLLNLGAQAVSAENSAVTATRMAQLVTDLVGKLIVLPYANPENFVSGRATATDTTSTSLIGAPASGLRNYITQITVWNSSAVSTYIKIQDGSGGTELYDIPAPAGGGATLTLPTPLRQPTTATAIFFAANASANAVFVSASGYKGA